MNKQLTAVMLLLKDFEKYGQFKDGQFTLNIPHTLFNEIADKWQQQDKFNLKGAFNEGEMNVHNSKRDEGKYEYEGGLDYITKTYH